MTEYTTRWRTALSWAVPLLIVAALAVFLMWEPRLAVGSDWRGFLPTLGDEPLYPAHVHTIAEGNYTDGNPYFVEHKGEAPIVLWGGAWINAVPFFLGIPNNAATYLNFFIWSLLFAASLYALLRELMAPRWLASIGVVLLYLESFTHIWRPVNLQPVYPFFFLFYLGLARFIKSQTRTNGLLMALCAAASFYLFSYLWQAVVITLGLLCLWALTTRQWPLIKSSFIYSALAAILGAPAVIYTLWLSHASPYFWESIARFGLVHTHIPTSEVLRSGGWVGLVVIFIACMWWLSPRKYGESYVALGLFVLISGLGLWIEQGSNLLTGIYLETGEHLRELIITWLGIIDIVLVAFLLRQWGSFRLSAKVAAALVVALCTAGNLYYTYYYFMQTQPTAPMVVLWRQEQTYVGPIDWLQANVQEPVVVWSDPHNYITNYIPASTRHYTLFSTFAVWNLVPQSEITERYLVSQYFDNPSTTTLLADLTLYMGRQYLHLPPTIAREIFVCKALHFWQKNPQCGTPKTAEDILGDAYFAGLRAQFVSDIRPNIKEYLAKYHVSYILKNKQTDTAWHPGVLGAVPVYQDANWELYKLP